MKKLLLACFTFIAFCAHSQNVGIGTSNPQDKLHVEGTIYINSSLGGLKIGYPGVVADYWEFLTTNGGSDLRVKTNASNGTIRYPFYYTQDGKLGINLDTLPYPNSVPKYALHVAARNKYAIYGIASQYGSDTVAGVVGFANSPTPVPFSAGVRGESNSTTQNGIGVIGLQFGGGWGVAGFAKELGVGGYGAGVYGGIGRSLTGGTGTGGFGVLAENYNASGIAGAFRNYGGTTGKALQTSGPVQLTGIGEAAGKVLTSDASGNATWQNQSFGFIHRATTSNTSSHITTLSYSNPLQTDIIIVTHNYNPVGGPIAYNNHPIGVYWTGSAWTIYNEDYAAIVNTAYNVMVMRQ